MKLYLGADSRDAPISCGNYKISTQFIFKVFKILELNKISALGQFLTILGLLHILIHLVSHISWFIHQLCHLHIALSWPA